MILQQQQNQFRSGIDKLSIRQIMNIYDVSGNQNMTNNRNNNYVPRIQHDQNQYISYPPQRSDQNFNFNQYPQKVISEQLMPEQYIPVKRSKCPQRHIEQDSKEIELDTLEQYNRKKRNLEIKKNQRQESRSKSPFRKKIFDRIKPSNKNVLDGMSYSLANNSANNRPPSFNNAQDQSDSRRRGINLISKKNNSNQFANSLPGKPNSFIKQNENHSKTLLSNNEFQRALATDFQKKGLTSSQPYQTHNTSLGQVSPNKQFNSMNFSSHQPLLGGNPFQQMQQRFAEATYKSKNQNQDSNILELLQQKKNQFQNQITDQHAVPNSPFSILSQDNQSYIIKRQTPIIKKLEQLPDKVSKIEDKISEHDRKIEQIKAEIEQLKRQEISQNRNQKSRQIFPITVGKKSEESKAGSLKPQLQKQAKIINEPTIVRTQQSSRPIYINDSQLTRNYNTPQVLAESTQKVIRNETYLPNGGIKQKDYENLVKQRKMRMQNIQQQNSRLTSEIQSQSSKSHIQYLQESITPKKMEDGVHFDRTQEIAYPFSKQNQGLIPNQINNTLDAHVFPMKVDQKGHPKYFILSSPAERDMAKELSVRENSNRSIGAINQKGANLQKFSNGQPKKVFEKQSSTYKLSPFQKNNQTVS